MIRFQNVTKMYPPDSVVLENISFEIKEGEFVSIVGKSGAGKTTLIHMILGLEKPSAGHIFFEGENVGNMDANHLQKLRRRIGGVHQDYRLLSSKTVFENVAYIMEIEGKEAEAINEEVPRVLDAMGL